MSIQKCLFANFLFLYFVCKRENLLLSERRRDCIATFVHFMLPLKLVYICWSTYCDSCAYTCDCFFLGFTCSSEHFAKDQFATISLTFVKATGQSNKLLGLCLSASPGPPPSPPSTYLLSLKWDNQRKRHFKGKEPELSAPESDTLFDELDNW